MDSDKKKNILEEGFEQVREYINLKTRLVKMEVAEKAATTSAFIVALLLIFILGFFCILFLSIMAGFYFSMVLHSTFYGFGIIAAFYLLCFLLVLIFRKSLVEKPLVNKIIAGIFDKDEEENS